MVEFDITLKPKDMYRFNIYQVYSGFTGWFSIIISILIFVWAAYTYGRVSVGYTVLYIVFGIVFIFYMPLSLMARSKAALAASDVLKNALHYRVDDAAIEVSQGDASSRLEWDQVYKLVATKSNVLIYSNRTNAYVIPRDQLGDRYAELSDIASQKLPKYRIKLK
jgi:hypothetical protein